MERHYFGLSTLLASVALLIWSIGETFAYPQGPNVSLGSNPIAKFRCANNYTNSTNSKFIITDFLNDSASSGKLIKTSSNGNTIVTLPPASVSSLTTGYVVEPGESIFCAYTGVYLTGYYVQ